MSINTTADRESEGEIVKKLQESFGNEAQKILDQLDELSSSMGALNNMSELDTKHWFRKLGFDKDEIGNIARKLKGDNETLSHLIEARQVWQSFSKIQLGGVSSEELLQRLKSHGRGFNRVEKIFSNLTIGKPCTVRTRVLSKNELFEGMNPGDHPYERAVLTGLAKGLGPLPLGAVAQILLNYQDMVRSGCWGINHTKLYPITHPILLEQRGELYSGNAVLWVEPQGLPEIMGLRFAERIRGDELDNSLFLFKEK